METLNTISKRLEKLSEKLDTMNSFNKKWLSVEELSKYLGLKTSTIYQYVHRKHIPFNKLPGSRKLIFCKDTIDEWIESYSFGKVKKEAKKISNDIWNEVLDKNK